MGRRRADDRPLPDWARALKAAREAAGYRNQAEFGRAIGYSQQRVGDWESGKSRPPPEAVPSIADKLGIRPQTLLPPQLAAAMEGQAAFAQPRDVDEALAALVQDVHQALTEAGAQPSIQNAARLAIGAWRLCGGSLADLPDPHALRAQVQSLRELWRDLANIPRRPE